MKFNGYIMSGNIPVANVSDDAVVPINKGKMPLYLANGGSICEWISARAIDRHRPNSRILKKVLRMADTSDILTVIRANAATITDDYWLLLDGENITYDDVRFKGNYFADLALMGNIDSFNREFSDEVLYSKTPELTNVGSYEKCWKYENGQWYMYKQGNDLERFSEVFISRLSREFNFPTAEYISECGYIKTRDFTLQKYNFEPMAALVFDNEDYCVNFDMLWNIGEKIASEYVDLIFMNTLCFNMDRHTYNYGLMRLRETGEIVSLAPNFDNNIALISRGYACSPTNSANFLIQLFLEFLNKKNISYRIPLLSKSTVLEIAKNSVQDSQIDVNYVADFIMDRYERISKKGVIT